MIAHECNAYPDMLQKMCPPLRTLRGYLSVRLSENSFYSEVYGKYSIARVAIINERIVGYIIARLILDEGHLPIWLSVPNLE